MTCFYYSPYVTCFYYSPYVTCFYYTIPLHTILHTYWACYWACRTLDGEIIEYGEVEVALHPSQGAILCTPRA